MDSLSSILRAKKINRFGGKINAHYERAVVFLEYIGVEARKDNIFFLLKLCRLYKPLRVYALASWFKDLDFDKKRWKGLIVWKLKQDSPQSLFK